MVKLEKAQAMSNLSKILHADDCADIRELTKMSLEILGGFKLLQCTNGQETLDQAEKFNPDLILMDVMMPVKDGPTAVRKLRQISVFSDTPVVFMTAKASSVDVERLKDEFKADVITKPFDPTALPDQLRSIWEKLAI